MENNYETSRPVWELWASVCYLRAIRVNQGPIKDQLGCPEALRRLQVPLQASMNINLFTSETHIVSPISQLPEITHKWF